MASSSWNIGKLPCPRGAPHLGTFSEQRFALNVNEWAAAPSGAVREDLRTFATPMNMAAIMNPRTIDETV
jgi:hypothetical protein